MLSPLGVCLFWTVTAGQLPAIAEPDRIDCVAAEKVFPFLPREDFATPPVPPGPFAVSERYVMVDNLGDGQPGGITIFSPTGVTTPRPLLLWVLGINNRAYYHQSLHETLASYGYVTVIPDTRPFCFLGLTYHRRNVTNARRTYDRAVAGEFGVSIDRQRTALGGYSSGGSLAAFAAADRPQVRSLALWAPAPAPVWYGVNPEALLPRVRAETYFLLGELDNAAPPTGWPKTMQQLMTRTRGESETIIPQAVHLFFQQPSGVDSKNPPTTITRPEQTAIAINATRAFLDRTLGAP